MKARIDRHRRDRLEAFTTVEEPLDLEGALRSLEACDVAVVDCLTHWLSNLLVRNDQVESILERVDGVVGFGHGCAFLRFLIFGHSAPDLSRSLVRSMLLSC